MTTILLEEILERGEIDKTLGLLSLRLISVHRAPSSSTYILTLINKSGVIRKDVTITQMELINALSPIDTILHKIIDCFDDDRRDPPGERHKAVKGKLRRRIRS